MGISLANPTARLDTPKIVRVHIGALARTAGADMRQSQVTAAVRAVRATPRLMRRRHLGSRNLQIYLKSEAQVSPSFHRIRLSASKIRIVPVVQHISPVKEEGCCTEAASYPPPPPPPLKSPHSDLACATTRRIAKHQRTLQLLAPRLHLPVLDQPCKVVAKMIAPPITSCGPLPPTQVRLQRHLSYLQRTLLWSILGSIDPAFRRSVIFPFSRHWA